MIWRGRWVWGGESSESLRAGVILYIVERTKVWVRNFYDRDRVPEKPLLSAGGEVSVRP